MQQQDYYKVLGISKDATTDEIKKAYRQLASKYHPDKIAGPDGSTAKTLAEAKFKEVKEAYECLSDADSRYHHDVTSQSKHYSGGSHNDYYDDMFKSRSRATPGAGSRATREEFTDLFKDFFNSKSDSYKDEFQSAFRQSEDVKSNKEKVIPISLSDAYTGKTIRIDSQSTIVVPKGVRSGTKFYSNMLLYRIDVLPHDKFKRSNDDLLVDVTISAIEAMIGTEAILEHLDSVKLQFTIPAGIQTGQIVKLSSRGMKNPETDKCGDILVRITVTVPKNLSAADVALLKKLSHRESINI